MLNRIISFSIHNKLLVGLMVLGLIFWGGYSLSKLPIDAVPDITNNQVQIITVSPSLGAEDIERLITFPIEQSVSNVPGLEEVRSFSRFGLSLITVVFNDDIDVYWARQQITERLKIAQELMPMGSGVPELAPVSTGLSEIYQYTIHPKPGYESHYTLSDLRSIQDWTIRRQLLRTPGVADVSSFGGDLKQYEIAIDSEYLAGIGVSITEIFEALNQNNANAGGAYIEHNANAYFIRTEGLLHHIQDIENVVVKRTSGSGIPILIKDVAKVRLGKAIRYGAMLKDGEEVAGGVVLMLKGENSKKVIAHIKERIADIEKTLPEGVAITPFLDRTKLVNESITTVSKNLLEGAIIVILVLVLLLGNLRAGLVVASVIPLSMLFAISMMHLFGVSGNLMSLGAIDFGLIVDGAVIIVESVLHYISLTPNTKGTIPQGQMNDLVEDSSKKMMRFASFGQLIILIVYLPLLTLVGIEGKMFRPMAQTVAFALLGALLLSLTYIPALSALVLRKQGLQHFKLSDTIMDKMQDIYQPALQWVLLRKRQVLVTAFTLFVVAIVLFLNMGGEFIPTLDEGDFACETRVSLGSSLERTIDVSKKATKILKAKFPEIEQVVAKVGTGEIPTDPMPLEAADLMIILKHKSEWTSAKDREDFAQKITEALSDIPEASFGVQQPISMRFNELMTGAKQDVVLKIYGENLDSLALYSQKLSEQIKGIKGVVDIYVEQISGLPQIIVKMNRERLAQFGLTEQMINESIESSFSGAKAGIIYEGEKRFDLVVRLNEQSRSDITNVQNLLIRTHTGQAIPLNYLAEVSLQNMPNQIQRDNTQRRIIVGFNVRNSDVETIVGLIKQKVKQHLKLPVGYHITYGGQFQNLQKAKERLSIAVPVSLFLILVLLFFAFQSIKQSLLIFSAIPLAAIGGVFALLVRGMPFSISAGVGFIALFGIAVLNGIVLIAHFNQLKEKGIINIIDRITQGTRNRLRPIAMTALVASFGFLPMAISNASGAEVQKPLATVVIGGLITATLLTLFVLPVLYYFSETYSIKHIKRKIPFLTGLLLFSFYIPANAQILSLKQAIHHGLIHNLELKLNQYDVEMAKKIIPSALEIGKTNVSYQYGKFNSNILDNGFYISQSVPFPTVLIRHHQLLKAQLNTTEQQLILDKKMLIARIKFEYAHWAFYHQQLKIFERQDTIYNRMLEAIKVRFRVGDLGLFEKNNIEIQILNARNNMAQIRTDGIVAQRTFLHTIQLADSALVPENLINQQVPIVHFVIDNTPDLQFIRAQIAQSSFGLKLEKSKALPDIFMGVNNQTINPLMPSEESDKRYKSYQIGLAMPLFFAPQKSRIEAQKIQLIKTREKYEVQKSNVRIHYEMLVKKYKQCQFRLENFEQELLPKSKRAIMDAEKSFREGIINYMQMLQIINNDVDFSMQYLQTLLQNHQLVSQIEYYQNLDF